MTPPADQTFALDSMSRSLGGKPAAYDLNRPGWRYVQTALGVAYVCLGVAYLVREDSDVFMGVVFLVLGILMGLQVAGLLKRPSAAPTYSLSDAGVRYLASSTGTERHAAWGEVESVDHRAGRIVLSIRDGLPIVVAFTDVSYTEAQAIKEATDAWARHEQIPLL